MPACYAVVSKTEKDVTLVAVLRDSVATMVRVRSAERRGQCALPAALALEAGRAGDSRGDRKRVGRSYRSADNVQCASDADG